MDCSRELIEKYAREDKRIKFIDLKENVGFPGSRNVGIRESKEI